MRTVTPLILRTLQAIGIILLTTLALSACGPQPNTVPTEIVPTNVPPTQVLPSPTPIPPTPIPPTITPEPPVAVKSLEEIVGIWKSGCGGTPCEVEFRADGTYRIRFAKEAESPGVIDRGNITFSDGVFHLESISGLCQATPNGFFQASLIGQAGQPYLLEFEKTQPDECVDRQNTLGRPMIFAN
jgi:hypothetical protein